MFASPVGGPHNPRTDWSDWKQLVADAELRDARLHDWRHTAATALLLLGVAERMVTSRGGMVEHSCCGPDASTSRPSSGRRRRPCLRIAVADGTRLTIDPRS